MAVSIVKGVFISKMKREIGSLAALINPLVLYHFLLFEVFEDT